MICIFVSALMLTMLIMYVRDQREARRARASNARVLREFKRMMLYNPEKIVSPRRDLPTKENS